MADENECGMCGATFEDEEELQEHAREEHGQEIEE